MITKQERLMILKNVIVYSENATIQSGYLSFQNGKISSFGPMEELLIHNGDRVLEFPKNYKLIPGMIDIHIHGAAGADAMDATKETLELMAQTLPKEGTTSFLATTMTDEKERIEPALQNAASYMEKNNLPGKAEILGVHLEGPFISPLQAGAQPIDAITQPNVELFIKWQKLANNQIKLVTLAPEIEGALELIAYLKENGVVASAGHSDATYEQMLKGIQAGISHITHMFNGMRGLHHREPGVAGTSLLHDELTLEVITDGIHVHPSIVKLIHQLKGREGIILITDSMRAKWMEDGTYTLGSNEVFVKNGKALLENGKLAGSTLKMVDAIHNMMEFTGCSLEDITYMASQNPAKELGIFDKKGSIAVGKDADLVLLNEKNQVEMTICRGQVAFSSMEVEV